MADNKKKIVLIEDEEILATMYKLKFSKAGYDIQVAADGEQGLALVKEVWPDLILLDIIMPKKDGFAVLKELKADLQLRNIPIYLLTNLGQEEDVKKGKELGATGYFVKANFTPGEIVKEINKYFER